MSSRRRRERANPGRARTPEQFHADVRAAASRTTGKVTRCALCGDPRVAAMGLWFPSDATQAKLLVPSGKFRAIGYGACRKCSRLPDLMKRVEVAILADFAEMAASPLRN